MEAEVLAPGCPLQLTAVNRVHHRKKERAGEGRRIMRSAKVYA
jgi:hypothetical protein